MDIVTHFSCHTVLPVKLDLIKEHILEQTDVLSIRFIEADLDPSVLFGFLRVWRWKAPYGNINRRADIFYSTHISPEMQRLVICKEMLHLLDNHQETAQTIEMVTKLFSEIVVPLSMLSSIPGRSDHMGIIPALCVLMPRDALDQLREHHKEGRLSAGAIAALAGIPEAYIPLLLSDLWKEVVEIIK